MASEAVQKSKEIDPAQLKGRLVHFGARNALDIEGLGEETAALLVDRELVRELAQLFDLDVPTVQELPGFAEKSATNLVDGIQARRKVELAQGTLKDGWEGLLRADTRRVEDRFEVPGQP